MEPSNRRELLVERFAAVGAGAVIRGKMFEDFLSLIARLPAPPAPA
jgi:hypothetical protein